MLEMLATLLVLSQDLAPPVVLEDHEVAFRPPVGWTPRPVRPPSLVKFVRPPAEGKGNVEILFSHVDGASPTPMATWTVQSAANVKESQPEAKILEEKKLEVNGRPAHLLSWSEKGVQRFKLGILRTNLEWYVVDAFFPEGEAAAVRPLLDASAASLRILPKPLSPEERVSLDRTRKIMGRVKLDPALKGERWYVVALGARKLGHQRVKIDESADLVTFEVETSFEVSEGSRDVATVRGSFSPDGRIQKVETEQHKQDKKEKRSYRATASLDGGQVRVRRDMNGAVEEKTFVVEEGVLLGDVVEIYRSFFAEEGKGSYFIRTLNVYADEPSTEQLDVADPEKLKLDGVDRKVILISSTIDRRRTLTNAYGLDRRLVRMGGASDPLVVKVSTKEEAVGK